MKYNKSKVQSLKSKVKDHNSEDTSLTGIVGLAILLVTIVGWGTVCGQGIKVGEEMVLMAPGDPGGIRRGEDQRGTAADRVLLDKFAVALNALLEELLALGDFLLAEPLAAHACRRQQPDRHDLRAAHRAPATS